MRYLVKISELKQKINYLEKQLSIIDENITNLKNVKSSIIWQGDAFLKFSDKYDDYINRLVGIEEKTISSIDYLMKFYKNYGDDYMSIRAKFTNLSNREM